MLHCLQKFRRVTCSHDQVLAELESAHRDLQAEQNKVISLQTQLKQGSSSSIALTEVNGSCVAMSYDQMRCGTELTLIDWLIESRFYIPLDTVYNLGHWRCSAQPVSWLRTKETKPNTTKASNTGIKWSKLTWRTQKMLHLSKHTKTKSKPKPTWKFKNCLHVHAYYCAQLTYTIHNFQN